VIYERFPPVRTAGACQVEVLFIGKNIWQVEIETVCCSFQNLFREKIVLDITKNCGWSRTFNS
jgi:hypothetical protein